MSLSVALAACTARESRTARNATADSIANALSRLGDTSNPYAHATGHRYGAPTGKIRVANFIDVRGQPSGPIDVYDVRQPDSATAPLIRNLAYGQVSAYVSPRGADPYAGSPSNLYAFPAGQRQASSPFGSNLDSAGFTSIDQLTLMLGPSSGFGGAPQISRMVLVEEGHRLPAAQIDSAHQIPAGQALLVSGIANSSLTDSLPEQYLMIDGACPHAWNDRRVVGDTIAYKREPSALATSLYYAVAPGAHTLGVVTSPPGRGLLDCNGKTPGPTVSVNLQAGRRYAVFVYGVPSDGFKVAVAPIDAR